VLAKDDVPGKSELQQLELLIAGKLAAPRRRLRRRPLTLQNGRN